MFVRFFQFFFMLILSATIVPAFGQWNLMELQQLYPNSNYMVLEKIDTLFIYFENDSLKAKESNFERKMYLNNQAYQYTKESIGFSKLAGVQNINAATLLPVKKGRYKTVQVEEITEKDEFESGIFHDDSKSKNFSYPLLQEGAQTVLSYDRIIKEIRFIGGNYFAGLAPILLETYYVVVDKNVELGYQLFNIDSSAFTFSVEETAKKKIYKWTLKTIPPLKLEENSLAVRYFMPHILVYVKSYTLKGERHTVLSNLSDLNQWYYNFIDEVQQEDSTVSRLAHEITATYASEIDKVKAVFYWVQDHVKYIAFEDGYGGFIPRKPSEVCQKRYGDCKDMANLIRSMLVAVGVDVKLCWLGSRDLPYKYSEIATPAVDNHMIAVYFDQGKALFLDATNNYVPFGLPTAFIQGKEALVNIDSTNYKLFEVPVVDASINSMRDSVFLFFDASAKLRGKGKVHYSGLLRASVAEYIDGLNKEELIRFFIEYFKKGNNKFIITDLHLENLEDRDNDLIVHYTLELDDYVTTYEDEMYINLNLEKPFKGSIVDSNRVHPVENDFKSSLNYVIHLEIPQGYKVVYTPENFSFSDGHLDVALLYKTNSNELIYQQSYKKDFLLLEKDYFRQWNTVINSLGTNYKEAITFKKIE